MTRKILSYAQQKEVEKQMRHDWHSLNIKPRTWAEYAKELTAHLGFHCTEDNINPSLLALGRAWKHPPRRLAKPETVATSSPTNTVAASSVVVDQAARDALINVYKILERAAPADIMPVTQPSLVEAAS